MERYIHKHGSGGGIVVLQKVARFVCVCVSFHLTCFVV
jgi:hypothetical protein